MATVDEANQVLPVIRLSELQDGQEAECFAALVNRILGKTYKGDPFVKCVFRDRRLKVDAMLWSNHRFHQQAQGWTEGIAYRLRVRASISPKYGLQLDIFDMSHYSGGQLSFRKAILPSKNARMYSIFSA